MIYQFKKLIRIDKIIEKKSTFTNGILSLLNIVIRFFFIVYSLIFFCIFVYIYIIV